MTHIFDALAENYDSEFTQTTIGQHLRQRVHQRFLKHWQAGASILELGCGTGEDAYFLAQNGLRVTATDASSKMLEIATQKGKQQQNLSFRQLDLQQLPANEFQEQFDGVYSNFGALNCLSEWKSLAEWLVTRIKVGGIAGFGIMSPYCFWEIAWHSVHLDFNTAFRRLRTKTDFSRNQQTISITYPTIRDLTQQFQPYFERIHIQGLGIVVPTSDGYQMLEKYPRLQKSLLPLDSQLGKISQLALLADHYWVEFQRTSA